MMTNVLLFPPKIGQSVGQLMGKDFDKRTPFWGPVLTSKNLCMIYAPAGVGKTYFTLSLCWAVASGCLFLGRGAERPLKIIYFDGEMGEQALSERLWQIAGASAAEPLPGAMSFVTFADCEGGTLWNLASERDQARYTSRIADHDIVVIDNLSTAMFGVDGRDDEIRQWSRVSPWVVKMRDAGKCVILIHHTNKAGTELGSVQKRNICDTVIGLRKPLNDVGGGSGFELHYEKHRHFYGADAAPLHVEYRTSNDGGLYWHYENLHERIDQQVATLLAEGVKPRAVAEQLGLPLSRVFHLSTKPSELPLPTYEKGVKHDDHF